MEYGYGYGYSKSKKKKNKGKRKFPCSTGITFQSDVLLPNSGEWDNKIVGGDNATFTKSNCIYFDGTAYAEKIFTSDILQGANILIEYSLNGTTKLILETGDVAVSGLLGIDLANRILTVGKNGTDFFTGWISRVLINDEIEWTLTSGSIIKEYNRLSDSNSLNMLNYTASNIFVNKQDFGVNPSTMINKNIDDVDYLFVFFMTQSNGLGGLVVDENDIPENLRPYINKVFVKDYEIHTNLVPLMDAIGTNAYHNLNISVAVLGLEIARQTGKFVCIPYCTYGGSGMYTNPSWKVSDAQLATLSIASAMAAYNEITGTKKILSILYNQSEADAVLLAQANAYKQNMYDLLTYWISQIGYNVPILLFYLNWRTKYYQDRTTPLYGAIVDAAKTALTTKNDALYIPQVFIQSVDNVGIERIDNHHYIDKDAYINVYLNTANKLLGKTSQTDQIAFVKNPSIKLNSQLSLPVNFYTIGAKTMGIRFNFNSTTGAIRNMIYNFNGTTTGIRMYIPANANYGAIAIVQGGVNIINLTVPSLGGYGNILFLCTWDGTTSSNSFKACFLNMDYGKKINTSFYTATPSSVESAHSNLATRIIYTSEDIYSAFSLNRALTDSEMTLLEEGRDNEISGIRIFPFNEGYGTEVYDNSGIIATDLTGVTRTLNNKIPFVNKLANYKLQYNLTNYRVVPQSVTDAGGWTIVENINPLYFYYVLGGKLKFPQIPELVAIDTANVLYDVTTGLAKEVTGAELIAANGNGYLTVSYDNYKITAINISDINILEYINVASEQKDFPTPFNLTNGFLKRDTLRLQLDNNYNPVVSVVEGDVLHLPIYKGHNLAETNMKWNGVEYDFNIIQTILAWLTIFFARQRFVDGVLVGYDRVCIYSSTLLGACFNKTIRFIKALFLVRRNEDGSIRYDSNGEYIIDRE